MDAAWREVAPFPYTASAFGSVLIAAVAISGLNLFGKQRATKWVTRRCGDEMMNMPLDAFYAVQPVMLTTITGRVYVGLLDRALTLNPHMPYVSLLPTLSGYRDKETLDVTLTLNCTRAYLLQKDVSAMRVILPTQSLCLARAFDLELYDAAFEAAGDGAPGNGEEARVSVAENREFRGRALQSATRGFDRVS